MSRCEGEKIGVRVRVSEYVRKRAGVKARGSVRAGMRLYGSVCEIRTGVKMSEFIRVRMRVRTEATVPE